MWTLEELPDLEQLAPADQLWLIALAAEENGGPAEYVQALRSLADQLEELRWWALGEPVLPGRHWTFDRNRDGRTCRGLA